MSGEDLRVLAEEQVALRRVAMLVARGAAPEEARCAGGRGLTAFLAGHLAGALADLARDLAPPRR